MTTHHNDWDTSAQRGDSSRSTTSSSPKIAALTHCETCGGPHQYFECQAAGGFTQGDVYAATGSYTAGVQYDAKIQFLTNQMTKMEKAITERTQGALPSNTVPNPKEEIKVITTRSGITLAGPSLPPPPLSSSSKELALVAKSNVIPERNPHQPPIPYPLSLVEALALMPKYAKMLKDILSNKEKLLKLANTPLNENCSAILLKNSPEKLGDPERFFIPCDFSELGECMDLADLGASINLIPLFVWKKLMLPELTPTRMTLELANRSVAYPVGIAEDVFIPVGKFSFPADFVVIDYDVDPCVLLILGRPFLRTARALADVHGEELILRVGDKKLTLNAYSTSKYPHKHRNESINMINFIDITCEDHFDKVLTPFKTVDSLLEEFADELALIDLFPQGNDDINFNPEYDLIELEYLLNRDPSIDYSFKNNIDMIGSILEEFPNEPSFADSFPLGNDDDDLFNAETDNEEWKNILYHDPFDDINIEKGKIKDSKMKILIDEASILENNDLLPLLPATDSSLHEEFSEIDSLSHFLK
ncbi:reverse transcriptase domain-containing protein [Tanacetum coccineum]